MLYLVSLYFLRGDCAAILSAYTASKHQFLGEPFPHFDRMYEHVCLVHLETLVEYSLILQKTGQQK